MKILVDGALPRKLGLTKAVLKAAAAFFAAKSAARVGETFREVAIVVQDDEASGEAHSAIMDVDGPTDVITQRYEAMPPEEPGVYGELYVNADQAIRYVRDNSVALGADWTPAKEFLLYVAHGMDHLSGADDHTEADYRRMRRRELGWLAAFAKTQG